MFTESNNFGDDSSQVLVMKNQHGMGSGLEWMGEALQMRKISSPKATVKEGSSMRTWELQGDGGTWNEEDNCKPRAVTVMERWQSGSLCVTATWKGKSWCRQVV